MRKLIMGHPVKFWLGVWVLSGLIGVGLGTIFRVDAEGKRAYPDVQLITVDRGELEGPQIDFDQPEIKNMHLYCAHKYRMAIRITRADGTTKTFVTDARC